VIGDAVTTMVPPTVRVRFAPSPTGYLHIGSARTVLFNWLLARQAGGAFLLRIEDTDQARHVEDSVQKMLDDLRWLGLTWDEGPEVGGPHGPYYQSQRLDIYNKYLQRLLLQGDAYYALESAEELQSRRDAAKARKQPYKYERPDPLPTIEQGEASRKAGKSIVVRFKMPNEAITVYDDILGDVTLAAEQLEDFVIQKSDGFPTYHFACVVDDELMQITHVLRGQEHLMNTPKHVALQRALQFRTPKYGHMPVIFNMDGTKMSKRDKEKALSRGEKPPEIDVHDFRVAGYLPESIINFIALLGWSPGEDREQFHQEELTQRFRIERVGKTNARFDRVKLMAFNTDWVARVGPDRLLSAFQDYLAVNDSPLQNETDAKLRRLLQACEGFRTFQDVEEKTKFLFQSDVDIAYDPKAVQKVLTKNDGAGYVMLEAVRTRLQAQSDWGASALEAMFQEFCNERNEKLGNVAQPVRVAITGTTISPPIFDSLELLGKDRSIRRIDRCLSAR